MNERYFSTHSSDGARYSGFAADRTASDKRSLDNDYEIPGDHQRAEKATTSSVNTPSPDIRVSPVTSPLSQASRGSLNNSSSEFT